MNSRSSRQAKRRHSAADRIRVAAAVIAVLAGLAAAWGVGSIVLVRSQLQAAADSAALDAARRLSEPRMELVSAAGGRAGRFTVIGQPARLADVELGRWDASRRSFLSSGSDGGAVRVTTRCRKPPDGRAPGGLALLLENTPFELSASAVAIANPREIVFLVDLSAAMNDTPGPLRQALHDDLGFGDYPGQTEPAGQPWGLASSDHVYAALGDEAGPLAAAHVPDWYRIEPNDNHATRRRKIQAALIYFQIARLMPDAQPSPLDAENHDYWSKYLDYLLLSCGQSNPKRTSRQIGYSSYLQFLLDQGRDLRPDGRQYTPLSQHAPQRALDRETTAGGALHVLPRTQPMNAVRRALVEAIETIRRQNAAQTDPLRADRVALLTFDTLSGGGPVVRRGLSVDYADTMQACARLQAVGASGRSAAMDAALATADEHLRGEALGATERPDATRIVILVTSGQADLHASDPGAIETFAALNPGIDFCGDNKAMDGAVMRVAMMRRAGCQAHLVGVGPNIDHDFLDRLALAGGTAYDGGNTRGSESPAEQEERLVEAFEAILAHPAVRLVK